MWSISKAAFISSASWRTFSSGTQTSTRRSNPLHSCDDTTDRCVCVCVCVCACVCERARERERERQRERGRERTRFTWGEQSPGEGAWFVSLGPTNTELFACFFYVEVASWQQGRVVEQHNGDTSERSSRLGHRSRDATQAEGIDYNFRVCMRRVARRLDLCKDAASLLLGSLCRPVAHIKRQVGEV